MPWVGHWRQEWEKVGRWRPLSEIQKLPKIQDVYNKRDGLLVLTAYSKWSLYFSLDESSEVLRSGIEAHPFTAIGRIEKAKPTGHVDDDGRWIPHDHLSHSDYGFRCRRNFSVKAGYSKHGDGKKDRRLT